MSPEIIASGDKIEVKGSTSFFPATVFCSNENSDDNLRAKYTTIRRNADSDCYLDSVSVTNVRPSPPVKRHEFRIGDFVEVFQESKGWRSGKLVGLCEESRCTVLIDGEEKIVNVACDELRPFLHRIDGSRASSFLDQKRTSEPEIKTKMINLKTKSSTIPLQTLFSVGKKVEVRSDEDGYEGSRYTATILCSVLQSKYLVEYHTIKTDDLTHPLQELVKEEDIRPYPPETPKSIRYRKGQAVDVWYNEGWWEGLISKVIGNYRYMVYFITTDEELMYQHSCLRPHQDWIDGNWVTPLSRRSGSKLGANSTIKKKFSRRKDDTGNFREGTDVEVKSNEAGFMGAWYNAVIVEGKGKNKFLVEYKTLRIDNESEFLKEVADTKDIRPCPPKMKVQSYEPLQKVDVWFKDGWWEGLVYQVLGSSKYGVYFSSRDEEMEFDSSYMRLHQKWSNGQWMVAGKVWRKF